MLAMKRLPQSENAPQPEQGSGDAELVEQFRAGDMRAFDAILAKYENPVFNFTYRMLGDYQNARDTTQDIFLRAFRYLGNYRGEGKFSTWLFTIASSTCKNAIAYYHIREKYSQRQMQDAELKWNDPLSLIPDYTAAPETVAMRNATAEMLKASLEELPETYRRMIVLRDINGFTYEEIAEICGCSLGTVKSRIARARLLLREKLSDPGHSDLQE